MLYYFVIFGFGFLIDKLKNKVIGLFMLKSVKMIKYHASWHAMNQPLYMDLLDWIVL